LYVAASQDSAKSVVTCANVALLEADDTVALDLFDQNPFQSIEKEVTAANCVKQVVPPQKKASTCNQVVHEEAVRPPQLL
jgi:hypothetical protein